MNKKVKIALIGVSIAAIFFWYSFISLLLSAFGFYYRNEDLIAKEYNKNYETISEIKDYLENQPYDTVNIDSGDYVFSSEDYGCWYVSDGQSEDLETGTVEINDDEFVKKLNNVFKHRKYKIIVKSNNTVYFQLWSTRDIGKGIAYSADGSDLEIDFLTNSEPLSEENWYYYEADFNEWKRLNEQG
ncbi:MAG: hypothetical protein LIO87_01620 [Eubacterium sp.]|nr:hypothetical protein [Eubacterium sp.]